MGRIRGRLLPTRFAAVEYDAAKSELKKLLLEVQKKRPAMGFRPNAQNLVQSDFMFWRRSFMPEGSSTIGALASALAKGQPASHRSQDRFWRSA